MHVHVERDTIDCLKQKERNWYNAIWIYYLIKCKRMEQIEKFFLINLNIDKFFHTTERRFLINR